MIAVNSVILADLLLNLARFFHC